MSRKGVKNVEEKLALDEDYLDLIIGMNLAFLRSTQFSAYHCYM
jgi:hypothetical protein